MSSAGSPYVERRDHLSEVHARRTPARGGRFQKPVVRKSRSPYLFYPSVGTKIERSVFIACGRRVLDQGPKATPSSVTTAAGASKYPKGAIVRPMSYEIGLTTPLDWTGANRSSECLD